LQDGSQVTCPTQSPSGPLLFALIYPFRYINDLHKRGKLKIIFVMMDETYTTRSTESVDGWLGIMIGDNLWQALWADKQLDQTAAAIFTFCDDGGMPGSGCEKSAVVMQDAAGQSCQASKKAKVDLEKPIAAKGDEETASAMQSMESKLAAGSTHTSQKSLQATAPHPPPASPTATQLPARDSIQSPPLSSPLFALSSPVSRPAPAAADLYAAYAILADDSKVSDPSSLRNALSAMGVRTAEDLAYIDSFQCHSIAELLRPVGRNAFVVLLGANPAAVSNVRDAMSPAHQCAVPAAADEARALSYITDSSKHTDAAAMALLLQGLGLTQPSELGYLDQQQRRDILALLKPVPRAIVMQLLCKVPVAAAAIGP
jgi:hypothetical protein